MKEIIQQKEQIKSQEQINKELIKEISSFSDLIGKFRLEISKIIEEGHLNEKLFDLIEEKTNIFVGKRYELLEKIKSNIGKDSNMYELVIIGSGDLLYLTTSIDDLKKNPRRNDFNKVLNETSKKFEIINLAIKVGENPNSKISNEHE